MIPFNPKKRERGDEPELDDDDGAPPDQPAKRKREAAVPQLDDNDEQQGHVVATDWNRWYGFVESVTVHDAPVRVHRTHRSDPVAAVQPAPQRVSVVFDCLSADWFENQVPEDLDIPWDTVAAVAASCRAEILVDVDYFTWINQRQSPVSGLPLPPIEEGTWWELRLEDVVAPPNLTVMLTLPNSDNPVSTILSPRHFLRALVDLGVPRVLVKLRRFSHGWGIFGPGLNDPPYPGR